MLKCFSKQHILHIYQTERERETDRQTDTDRHRQTDRQTDRQTERDRETANEREIIIAHQYMYCNAQMLYRDI